MFVCLTTVVDLVSIRITAMKAGSSTRVLASASRPAVRSLPSALPRYESTTAGPTGQSSTSSWQPVLPAGQNPAYDAALAFLDAHKSASQARIESLRSQPSTPGLQAEIRRLEVSSLVNDPSTRRLFRETGGGVGLMDQPVMRHLARRRWEKEGGLDLLMQRVEQLGVVPDLLGGVRGSLPIRFAVGGGQGQVVEPGSKQLPSAFNNPPSLHVQILDDGEEGLYTLMAVDPDSPNYETQSFAQRIHYLKSDIPLTVHSGEKDLFASDLGKEVLSWEPPLPPRGSGTHRYIFFLLRQPASPPTTTINEREGSELRTLLEQGYAVSAVTLFRSQWSAEENSYIETTYRSVHGTEVPVYEKPPKELRYGMPLNSKGIKREQLREEAWNQALTDMVAGAGEVDVKVE